MILDNENPWDGIQASTKFALSASVHTMVHYTPVPLVFVQDLILNISQKVN